MPTDTTKSKKQDRDCGPKCLYVLMRNFDCGNSGYRSLVRRMGNPTDAGYSLLQLRDAARECGLNAECFRIEKDQLSSLNTSLGIILHLNPGHFVILQSVNHEQLTVLDATTGMPKYCHIDKLSEWSGNALAVSKDSIDLFQAKQSGFSGRHLFGFLTFVCMAIVGAWIWRRRRVSWLFLIPMMSQLGCNTEATNMSESSDPKNGSLQLLIENSQYNLDLPQESGNPYQLSIALKNDCDTSIEVDNIKLSCHCATARLSVMRIEPNASASLLIMLERKTVGQKVVFCSLMSAGRIVAQVNVHWHVTAGLIVDPPRLDVLLGDSQTSTFNLVLSCEDSIDFSKFEFENEFQSQSREDSTQVTIHSAIENNLATVSFAAKPEVSRAIISGSIHIRHRDLPKISANVPFRVLLENPVDIMPKVLTLVEREGRFEGQILVKAENNSDLDGIEVTCGDNLSIECKFSTQISAGIAIIDVSLPQDTASLISYLEVKTAKGFTKSLRLVGNDNKEQ